MKRTLKIIAIAIVLISAALQFIRPDRTNPPVSENETLRASTDLPQDVDAILQRSCNDCHSNQTVYPWYSNVSPFSWFLADHIAHGRGEMNFSVWNTYSKEKKTKKLEEICEQVEAGFMPLPSYLWIHHDAILADAEVELLCGWARGEQQNVMR